MHSTRKYDGVDGPKVAIAHDYLTQFGGAEKVVLSMTKAFPDAPLYTMLYDPELTYPEFADLDIRVSALNKVGLARKYHRAALPIYPRVAESMYVDADVVLASCSGWSHGFRTNGKKLIYCYNPARWLYQTEAYLGDHANPIKRLGLKLTKKRLLDWDRRQALAADKYLAISTMISGYVKKAYDIDAEVMFAPVAMSRSYAVEPVEELEDKVDLGDPDGSFYLVVCRLLPYKNVDVIVRAFAGSDRQLVVVGNGPEAERLRSMKTDNVTMLHNLTDGQMAWLYKNCRALMSSSFEDYGLTPIEAGVWGRPSVALRFGGFLDTIDEGTTGLYFDEPQPDSVREALDRFESATWDQEKIKHHVSQFTEDAFSARLHEAVDKLAGC
ncbi:glycosyltransferase [Mycolicibacterium sp. lyk4-40-TYG-92]|uniref:glycosyltransferase n=1 Tax=Mycolicibacterium sp. lyk4-40-TYG-92 TaxID=3040295 RepID=UPI00254DF5C9|nr:glycosyltransferase [Mycolicibacterium sp. lyk4-40-TYG-92]